MAVKENLYLGSEARDKMMKGIAKVAAAVGNTMGTSGNNVLIEDMRIPGYLTTNDGFTAANSIYLQDPLEDLGRKVLLEAINKANKASGDGSSTTCVLTAAILEEGMKHIGESSPMEIKRSLEGCLPEIERSIREQAKKITVDEVSQVASISAEDESIGNMVQEIYKKIGKDGIISWDVSKTPEDHYTLGTGLKIDGATYVSRYMGDLANNSYLPKATLTNPKILLARRKLVSPDEVNGISRALAEQGIQELLVFCDDIEAPLVNGILALQATNGFRMVVVKLPVVWNDEWWEDLSFATGATIVGGLGLTKMHNVRMEQLGTCGRVTIDQENTYLDGIQDLTKIPKKAGNIEGFYDHISALKEECTEASLLRASRLNTKTARYFVGAHSESALSYRRLKVEDAINAAGVALENGIVAGGGIALANAGEELQGDNTGVKVLKDALLKPFNQIISNAGLEKSKFRGYDALKKDWGYNTKTGKLVDMFKSGIVDPADVVINAVKNAISVAAGILTIGTVVLLPRSEDDIGMLIAQKVAQYMEQNVGK